MCDTLGFIENGKAIFAKNSDRSPNEPQILEFIPAKRHSSASLDATYISIPQVTETHAVLLSRPTWLWGAEIGLNDCGVCIGNEAVWTLGKYGKTGLTGMDMLRLSLERCETADEAVKLLCSLLNEYGQGGNCGYDHSFYYDNSFLVMDSSELFVLETAGREWVRKRLSRAAISNRLSIGAEGDEYSGGVAYDFALRHSERLYNLASGSLRRLKQSSACIKNAGSVEDMLSALRGHDSGVLNPFAEGSVKSNCMHFGSIVGDHTTASMVVDLSAERSVVWASGSSCPCVSLFKPWVFGGSTESPLFGGSSYWYEQERFRRSLINKIVPAEYYAERDEIETRWLKEFDPDEKDFTLLCCLEEKKFFDKWSAYSFETAKSSPAFSKRWTAKNSVFTAELERLSE